MLEEDIAVKLDLPEKRISDIKHEPLLRTREQLVQEEFVSRAKAFSHTQ